MTDETRTKISTGPNARPVDESIAQTAPGLPDDTGAQPEALEDVGEGPEPAKAFTPAEDAAAPAPEDGRLQDKPEGGRAVVEKALREQETPGKR